MRSKITIVSALLFVASTLNAESAASSIMKVFLPREGIIELEGKPVSLEEFRTAVAKLANQDKQAIIRISAPPGVGHKLVATLFEICRAAGLTRISIETSL